MKRIILVICCLLFTICSNAQFASLQWAKSMGNTNDNNGNSIVTDAAGNSYTTGSFQGTVDFDPGTGIFNLTAIGGYDAFILKLDAAGNFLWAKQVGGSYDDYGYRIALDAAGNICVAGWFTTMADFDPGPDTAYLNTGSNPYNMFVLKLDATGNFVWAKNLDYFGPIYLVADASNSIYVAGIFIGTVDFDPGPGIFNLTAVGTAPTSNGYILKLDPSGNFRWAKRIGEDVVYHGGTDDNTIINSIALDKSGDLYAAGYFNTSNNFGTATLSPIGSTDQFISKLDSSGNFIWTKQIGGPYSAIIPQKITLDNSGNIYTVGYFTGTMNFHADTGIVSVVSTGSDDVFVSKLDSVGNFVWEKGIAETHLPTANIYVRGQMIKVDLSGNVYTAGYFDSTIDFDPGPATFNLKPVGGNDIFISKLDSLGNFIWAKGFGGNGDDHVGSIALDNAANIYTTGYFHNTVDFDPGPGIYNLTCAGSGEGIFIHKMSPTTTSIKDVSSLDDVTVYPNPTTEDYELRYKGEGNEPLQLMVSDITGRILLQVNLSAQQSIYHINATNWATGVYVYQLSQEDIMLKTGKLIKQ
jgi:hypothetical protein